MKLTRSTVTHPKHVEETERRGEMKGRADSCNFIPTIDRRTDNCYEEEENTMAEEKNRDIRGGQAIRRARACPNFRGSSAHFADEGDRSSKALEGDDGLCLPVMSKHPRGLPSRSR